MDERQSNGSKAAPRTETNPKFEILKSETQVRIEVVWNIGAFCHLILFRASDFVLRICPFIPWRPLRLCARPSETDRCAKRTLRNPSCPSCLRGESYFSHFGCRAAALWLDSRSMLDSSLREFSFHFFNDLRIDDLIRVPDLDRHSALRFHL